MEVFVLPLVGGLLIGIASSLLLFFNGKISGISGILAGALEKPLLYWRYFFLLGLSLGGFLLHLFEPRYFSYEISGSWISAVLGGVIVGFGTRLAGGCTSGHGVCGLPRFSKRSWLATVLFISSAMVTVWVRKFF